MVDILDGRLLLMRGAEARYAYYESESDTSNMCQQGAAGTSSNLMYDLDSVFFLVHSQKSSIMMKIVL